IPVVLGRVCRGPGAPLFAPACRSGVDHGGPDRALLWHGRAGRPTGCPAMNWTRQDTRALIEAAQERPIMAKWVVQAIRRHHGEPGLVEKMARLEDFTLTAAPHVWGQSDCSLVIADWAMANGYPDAATDLRGTYSTEVECRAVLAAR